ncbi:MAG TPA: NUDIX domain-containing protein, partial [Streptosporangiaceae bacterium]|nr:NUDIX domain-containing protein [Streptosporangiaceae bacterium]
MSSAWELIRAERRGQAGGRAMVAKTFRMPDGSEAVFTVTGDVSTRSVACLALTPRQTAVLAEQYRPGPERVMTELPGGGVEPGESLAGGAARALAEETWLPTAGADLPRPDVLRRVLRRVTTLLPSYRLRAAVEQQLDKGEFVTVAEVALGDLVRLAMTGEMTDPGGVLL